MHVPLFMCRAREGQKINFTPLVHTKFSHLSIEHKRIQLAGKITFYAGTNGPKSELVSNYHQNSIYARICFIVRYRILESRI